MNLNQICTIWAKFQPRLTFPAGCSLQPRVGWDFVAPIAAPPPPLSGGLIFIVIINIIIIIIIIVKTRRNNDGEPVCNACGLYYKLHGVNRSLHNDDFDNDRTGNRIFLIWLMNCMIVQFMIFTDYNSGHWRCVRTASRRERESPKVKKGADPRRKSKLKVCCHFFNRLPIFLPTFKKSCKHFFP